MLTRAERPDGPVTLALYLAHVRRKRKGAFDSSGLLIAAASLERITDHYATEKKFRGEPPATRQAIRWTETAPSMNAFGVSLDEQRSRVSPRSSLGEKIAGGHPQSRIYELLPCNLHFSTK